MYLEKNFFFVYYIEARIKRGRYGGHRDSKKETLVQTRKIIVEMKINGKSQEVFSAA